MQVPRIEKISVNVGVGQATQDQKLLDVVVKDLETIVGQKVVTTKSKKAISNFKLREGLPIGARVTLRRHRMYEFMDRFINLAVPRIRDFRGFSDKAFDGRGNYTVGVKEHIIFPEIDVDKVTKVFGMDISFVTTAQTDQEAYELLKAFGMPFVKRQEPIEKNTERSS
jgi:large subunit ribosomal protein L5